MNRDARFVSAWTRSALPHRETSVAVDAPSRFIVFTALDACSAPDHRCQLFTGTVRYMSADC
jgi:hypothetical protein